MFKIKDYFSFSPQEVIHGTFKGNQPLSYNFIILS